MKKLKLYLRALIIGIGVIIGSYLMYFFIVTPHQTKYDDCGIVVSKSADDIAIKHGVKTELYLNCKLEKQGFTSVQVTPTTYFGSKIGETVCFEFSHRLSEIDELKWILGCMLSISASLVIVVLFLVWVFTNKN